MTTTKQEPGVLGEAAAPLGVTRWVDASGQALEHFDLDRMPGRFKLIFCFQDACPGCRCDRLSGACPGGRRVSGERLRRVRRSPDRVRGLRFEHLGAHAGQSPRYALGIPFGHDAGDEQDGAGSELMRRYRNGGTPWFHPDRSRWQSGLQPFPNRRRQARHLSQAAGKRTGGTGAWARHVDLERSDSTGENGQPDATAPS